MVGEQVAYRTKLHWSVFGGAVFWVVLGVVMLSANSANPAGVLSLVFAPIAGVLEYIAFATSEFGVTTKRIIIKTGFIRRISAETLLTKVEGIAVEQGILGRLFGYGTIIVHGTGSTRTPYKKISNPMEFRRQVQQQIEISTQKPGDATLSAQPRG